MIGNLKSVVNPISTELFRGVPSPCSSHDRLYGSNKWVPVAFSLKLAGELFRAEWVSWFKSSKLGSALYFVVIGKRDCVSM